MKRIQVTLQAQREFIVRDDQDIDDYRLSTIDDPFMFLDDPKTRVEITVKELTDAV